MHWVILLAFSIPLFALIAVVVEVADLSRLAQQEQRHAREMANELDKLVSSTRHALSRIEEIDKNIVSFDSARKAQLAQITQVMNADWERILRDHAIQIADNMTNRIVSRQLELIPGYSLFDVMSIEDKIKWLEAVADRSVLQFTTETLVPKYKAKADDSKSKKSKS
jgi:threonine aldolase